MPKLKIKEALRDPLFLLKQYSSCGQWCIPLDKKQVLSMNLSMIF